jgi:hypothetical protein
MSMPTKAMDFLRASAMAGSLSWCPAQAWLAGGAGARPDHPIIRHDAVRFRAADSIQSQRLFSREIRYQRLCFLYKKAEVPSESATRPDYLEDACRPSSLGWYWLRLERLMCNMVCDGQIDIATAQAAFVTDWIAAYHTYYEARKKRPAGFTPSIAPR